MSFTLYPYYLRQIWWRYVLPERVKRVGVSVGKRVRCYGMPLIFKTSDSAITLGDDVTLCSVSEMTALGINHPVILRTLRPAAVILIGNGTGMSGGVICAAVRVEIGQRCLIGANVTIVDTDFHTISPLGRHDDSNLEQVAVSPVIIEDDVFIGAGVTILKGVRIGKNSVVGGGSVVTHNIPPDSVVAGNPARMLRGVF